MENPFKRSEVPDAAKTPGFSSLFAVLALVGSLLGALAGVAGIYYFKLARTEMERQKSEIVSQEQKLEETRREFEHALLFNEDLNTLFPESVQPKTNNSGERPAGVAPLSLAAIVAQWRPRIAHMTCDWARGGELLFSKSGSGVGFRNGGSTMFITTNRHVVAEEGMGRAQLCSVKFPDIGEEFVTESILESSSTDDVAGIKLELSGEAIAKIETFNSREFCPRRAVIGDAIIILGYPTIGAEGDITVTEGIISGLEGEYFITSAKVDQGNSGGAAILVKDNCYFGIPTFVKRGGFESLARILEHTAVSNILNQLKQ